MRKVILQVLVVVAIVALSGAAVFASETPVSLTGSGGFGILSGSPGGTGSASFSFGAGPHPISTSLVRLFTFGGGASTNFSVTPDVVFTPEPNSLLLLGSGILAVGIIVRRRWIA